MSRHGWTEGDDMNDILAFGRCLGQVASAVRGKRGQRLLRDMIAALDAMPIKELVPDSFSCPDGVCALGAVAAYRGVEVPKTVGVDDYGTVMSFEGEEFEDDGEACAEIAAGQLDIAEMLAREVMWENDEVCSHLTPADRWARMRRWAERRLKT